VVHTAFNFSGAKSGLVHTVQWCIFEVYIFQNVSIYTLARLSENMRVLENKHHNFVHIPDL